LSLLAQASGSLPINLQYLDIKLSYRVEYLDIKVL